METCWDAWKRDGQDKDSEHDHPHHNGYKHVSEATPLFEVTWCDHSSIVADADSVLEWPESTIDDLEEPIAVPPPLARGKTSLRGPAVVSLVLHSIIQAGDLTTDVSLAIPALRVCGLEEAVWWQIGGMAVTSVVGCLAFVIGGGFFRSMRALPMYLRLLLLCLSGLAYHVISVFVALVALIAWTISDSEAVEDCRTAAPRLAWGGLAKALLSLCIQVPVLLSNDFSQSAEVEAKSSLLVSIIFSLAAAVSAAIAFDSCDRVHLYILVRQGLGDAAVEKNFPVITGPLNSVFESPLRWLALALHRTVEILGGLLLFLLFHLSWRKMLAGRPPEMLLIPWLIFLGMHVVLFLRMGAPATQQVSLLKVVGAPLSCLCVPLSLLDITGAPIMAFIGRFSAQVVVLCVVLVARPLLHRHIGLLAAVTCVALWPSLYILRRYVALAPPDDPPLAACEGIVHELQRGARLTKLRLSRQQRNHPQMVLLGRSLLAALPDCFEYSPSENFMEVTFQPRAAKFINGVSVLSFLSGQMHVIVNLAAARVEAAVRGYLQQDPNFPNNESMLLLAAALPEDLAELTIQSFGGLMGQVTDEGFRALSQNLPPELHVLRLEEVPMNITDDAVVGLAENLPQALRHMEFTFSNCLVTPAAIKNFLQQLSETRKDSKVSMKGASRVLVTPKEVSFADRLPDELPARRGKSLPRLQVSRFS
mmetsp:Transcript_59746/g.142160  ORF Transcript_59746/g.142160 Transcript_59746/m.142160 type:complete len:704 (+) Transcript_59746:82-2193(+)